MDELLIRSLPHFFARVYLITSSHSVTHSLTAAAVFFIRRATEWRRVIRNCCSSKSKEMYIYSTYLTRTTYNREVVVAEKRESLHGATSSTSMPIAQPQRKTLDGPFGRR